MSWWVMAFFLAAGLLGMPLAFALGAAAIGGLWMSNVDFNMLPQRMMAAVNSFPLMAIPLFMVAGELMIKGGIMEQMVAFSNALVGRVRGGLAQVAMLAGAILSLVSGTAVSDAAALSSTLGPELKKKYGLGFSTAVIAASANLGPIIPPSAAMIVYAYLAGSTVSIAALFVAAAIPSVIITAVFMFQCWWIAKKRDFPLEGEPFSFGRLARETWRASLSLAMPIVCLGGIIGGVFTATEGAAIAVVLALPIGFFVTRKLKLSHLPDILYRSALMSGVVAALIAFASTVTFLLTVDLLPQQLAAWMKSITTDPTMFLLLVAVMLLIVGMFLESNAAYIMLVPLFHPIAIAYGIDPTLFAFLFVLNLIIGMMTPPVGVVLFVIQGMTGIKMGELVRHCMPFIVSQYALLLACIFFPALVTWLPRLMGYR
ncbi:MAG TPA: TRAP transporter large permease [Burkholderiales bacterium]|nr:TRAP transporter large permease [Burkholderiales bacterium]